MELTYAEANLALNAIRKAKDNEIDNFIERMKSYNTVIKEIKKMLMEEKDERN